MRNYFCARRILEKADCEPRLSALQQEVKTASWLQMEDFQKQFLQLFTHLCVNCALGVNLVALYFLRFSVSLGY